MNRNLNVKSLTWTITDTAAYEYKVGPHDRFILKSIAINFAAAATGDVYIKHTRGTNVITLRKLTVAAATSSVDFFSTDYCVIAGDLITIDTTNPAVDAVAFVTIER